MTRSIIDTHTHVWQRAKHPQDWIEPQTMAAIDRDFSVPELLDAARANEVASVVIVQASNSLSETVDILAASAASAAGSALASAAGGAAIADGAAAKVAAVVGWVDLTADVGAQLAALGAGAGSGKLTGIRHLAHTEADPRWLVRPDVSGGLEVLGAAGLSFDLVVRPTQLEVAREVAAAHPDASFVLDHLGKPPIAGGDLGDWERSIRALAAQQNVVAKLSGLTIEADWLAWTRPQIDVVLDVALEAFGPQRLMFGSDWPLVELSGGYAAWLEAYLDWSAGLAPEERAAIDSGTARRVYRTA